MRRSAWRFLFISEDIRNRLLISLALLVIYRLVAHVPVPGVNRAAIQSVLTGQSGTVISLFDLLSGGTVSNFSVLAMGVYPYITAQIILQLLTPIVPSLQRRMEEDPREGRKWQEKWTYYLAVPMAALNAIGQFRIFQQFARTGGQEMIDFSLGRIISDQQNALPLLLFVVFIMILTIFAIVFVQEGRRNVPVMYPGRRVGNRMSMPVKGTLPLMVNMAGMIPLIFAQSFLTFPAVLAQFIIGSANQTVSNIGLWLQGTFGGITDTYWILYFIMVVAFTFFYSDVVFSQQNYGENLKRSGAQVPGVTKGAATQRYLTRVLRRITLPGALFLGIVAIMPFIVGLFYKFGPSNQGLLLVSSSGLLIVVGVVRDTYRNIEAELKLRGYDSAVLVR
ncbi:MAG: preprotein translocase subunit SecY [Anaerolineales bacterium]